MKRVAVVGSSSSGKTTYAQLLALTLGFLHTELDAVYWQQNWCSRTINEFRKIIQMLIKQDNWIIDGNYRVVQDIIWTRATHIIWLNLPFYTVFWRAIRRTFSRVFKKIKLFSGNRETFRSAFLSRESIIWWVLTTYHRHQRYYKSIFKEKEYSHLKYIEIINKNQEEALIHKLNSLI